MIFQQTQGLPLFVEELAATLASSELLHRSEGGLTLAEGGSLEGYRWVREQAERLGAARTQTFAKGFERSMLSPADPFLSRKVAAIVQGPWMANFIDALAPDLDYGVIPVPQPAGVGAKRRERTASWARSSPD